MSVAGKARAGWRRWLPWLAVAVIALGVANFLTFFIVSSQLGGDALNGHVTDGHYYVAGHGTSTEVSEPVWLLSRIQGPCSSRRGRS